MAKRATALVFGLIVAILFLEFSMRLMTAVLPDREPPEMRAIPGAPPIVSSWPTDPPDQGRRILIVGDSFTLGRGVRIDQVYAASLASSLQAAGHALEVVSYSFPGWNSRAEAAAIERGLAEYDPDLLLVGHCLNDAERVPTARATANRPELRPWKPTGPVESFLDRFSVAFSRVRRAIDTIRLRPLLREYYQDLYRDERGRQLWRQSLARIHSLAEQQSIPSALIIFPIFDSDPDEEYAYRNLHGIVETTATEIGFEVLDLLPTYQGVDGRELALVPFTDPHPSALGHELAGQAIARFLEERGLLEPDKDSN